MIGKILCALKGHVYFHDDLPPIRYDRGLKPLNLDKPSEIVCMRCRKRENYVIGSTYSVSFNNVRIFQE